VEWAILGSIGLIVGKMQTVFSLWKFLLIAAGFPFIALNSKLALQIFAIEICI